MHRVIRSIVAASLLVTPLPAAAQSVIASLGSVPTPCPDPTQTGCTRGVLFLIDDVTGQLQSTVDLAGSDTNTRAAVSRLLADPGGTRIYLGQYDWLAVEPAGRWIDVFDLASGAKLRTLTVAGFLNAISPDGSRLFVSSGTSVQVVDSESGIVLSTIAPTRSGTDVAINRLGDRVYVMQSADTLAVYDGATYGLLQTIYLPGLAPSPWSVGAASLHVTPDDAHLYIVGSGGTIFDVDTTTNALAGTVDYDPGDSRGLVFARGRAYVAASKFSPGIGGFEGITVIDIATRTKVGQIGVSDPPSIAASLDGSRVFTHTFFESRLFVIDTSINQVVATRTMPTNAFRRLTMVPRRHIESVIVDQPSPSAAVQQPFDVSGWAADALGLLPGPGVDTVHVWAFPQSGAPVFVGADFGRPRPDVAALLGPTYANTGYRVTARGLAPGAYTFVAYGHSTRTQGFTISGQVSVNVAPSARVVVDLPRQGEVLTQPFDVAGWAFDGAAPSGTGIDVVHVWAFPNPAADPTGQPVFLGAAALGDPRPDVAAYFGAQFLPSGYHLTVNSLSRAPGAAYDLIVYAHSAVSGSWNAQRVAVQMAPVTPYMFIDAPTPSQTIGTVFTVAGWAAEVNGVSGTGVDVVHVWATSSTGAATFLGQASYGLSRPDVGAFLGSRYTASGFTLMATLPPGTYYISVYARSTTYGDFRIVRVVTVQVQ